MITLTTAFPVPNGTRLLITSVSPDDDNDILRVMVTLRSPAGSSHKYSDVVLNIRNGLCDRVSRGVMGADQGTQAALLYERDALTVASGFTNALAAWKAPASRALRLQALETHLLSTGVIHANLTGTVS